MTKTQNHTCAQFLRRMSPVLLCLALAGFCTSLIAQTTGACTITGTVTDPTGSVVPSASVVVKNVATGAELPLATSAAGIYSAPFLQPGSYEITVNKQGFGKTVRTNLSLQVGQTLTVNFAL